MFWFDSVTKIFEDCLYIVFLFSKKSKVAGITCLVIKQIVTGRKSRNISDVILGGLLHFLRIFLEQPKINQPGVTASLT